MLIGYVLDLDHGHVGDLGHDDALHLAHLSESGLGAGYQIEHIHDLDGELLVVNGDQAGGLGQQLGLDEQGGTACVGLSEWPGRSSPSSQVLAPVNMLK